MSTQLEITELKIYPVKSLAGISLPKVEILDTGLKYDRHWMVVTEGGEFVTQRKIAEMALITTALSSSELILSAKGMGDLHIPLAENLSGELREIVIHRKPAIGISEGLEASVWLTSVLGDSVGQRLLLVRFPSDYKRPVDPEFLGSENATTHFADAYPLLVTTEESLVNLNQRLVSKGKLPVEMDRFRPNIVIKGGAEGFFEDQIKTLQFGELDTDPVIQFAKPCSRCSVTTIDQQTSLVPERGEPLTTLATFRKMSGGVMFGQNAIVVSGVGSILALHQKVNILS